MAGEYPRRGAARRAGRSLCERKRAECVIEDAGLFSFLAQFKQTRDLSRFRK
jgi:hypothetical protein